LHNVFDFGVSENSFPVAYEGFSRIRRSQPRSGVACAKSDFPDSNFHHKVDVWFHDFDVEFFEMLNSTVPNPVCDFCIFRVLILSTDVRILVLSCTVLSLMLIFTFLILISTTLLMWSFQFWNIVAIIFEENSEFVFHSYHLS